MKKIEHNYQQSESFADISNEALQNLKSLYNADTLRINNLEVSNNAKLGRWNIRGDRIGIPGLADMHLSGDKWLRLLNYDGDTNNYAGNGIVGGFAGMNLWAERGKVWAQNASINNLNVTDYGNTVTVAPGQLRIFM